MSGDDHDPGLGDSMPPPILLLVVADQGAARNQDIAVDDRSPDASVPADADAWHKDALLDAAEAVNPHVRAEHAAIDAASRDDAAGRDDRVHGLSEPPIDVSEHEFGGGGLRLVRAQRPLWIIEVEFRTDMTEIHVRFE